MQETTTEICLILGSGSDIGQALAHRFARAGYALLLAARRVDNFQQRMAADLSIRYGIPATNLHFDGDRYESHDAFFDGLEALPDVVISVFGHLGDQDAAAQHFDLTLAIISANYTGHVSLLNRYVQRVRDKKRATIIGISSVAGERGRGSNYLYGSAKAGFTAYLSGLRNALAAHGIHVLTVKPGFVRTKMIESMHTPPLLTATPESLAEQVYRGFEKKQKVIYVKPVWRLIMLIIRAIPESLFKRLKL